VNATGQVVEVLIKDVLPALGAGIVLLAAAFPALLSRPGRWFEGVGLGLVAASRLAALPVLYLVLDFGGPYDLHNWWVPAADAVLAGSDPVILHDPFFPLLLAGGRFLLPLPHGAGVLLAIVLAEVALVFLGYRLARLLLGRAAARLTGLWLAVTPFYWFHTLIYAEEDALLAAFLVGGVLLLAEGRRRGGMATLGLGLAATKLTFAPYAAAAGVGAARRPADLLRLVLWAVPPVVLAVVAGLVFRTLPDLAEMERETAGLREFGVSLAAVATRNGAEHGHTVWIVAYAVALLGFLAALALRGPRLPEPWRPVLGAAAAHVTFLLLWPACLHSYHGQGAPVLGLVLLAGFPGGRARLAFAAVVLVDWVGTVWGRIGLWVDGLATVYLLFHGAAAVLLAVRLRRGMPRPPGG
jgi:hypothetical protein